MSGPRVSHPQRAWGRVFACGLLAITGETRAADADTTTEAPVVLRDDDGQAIAAALGFAGGGGWTPGGVHFDATYLVALDERDWFEIGLGLTFGGGGKGCSSNAGSYACNHGLADGQSLGFQAAVRHLFGNSTSLQPFIRIGAAITVIRFADDIVTTMTSSMGMPRATVGLYGIAIGAIVGGGVRVPYSSAFALTIAGALELGVAGFAGTADGQHLLGFAATAGIEFRP